MHIAVLLVAVLGPFVGLAAAEGADIVSKVRIEAPDPEGLERFVEVEAGRPLDPVAVRHTVELIYATGQFEDVRVELEREEDGGGVSVVIRALPAPLLVDVRVEGDRVLSAGTLRRITRLRRGEPLWESRCELAGRDAGLALKDRGYLEALVEVTAETVRGGADAIFHVHAGPRVRVGGDPRVVDPPEACAADGLHPGGFGGDRHHPLGGCRLHHVCPEVSPFPHLPSIPR